MYNCVVVGTNGSPTANRAVQAAAKLARDCGASLHIVSAYSTGAMAMAAAGGMALADSSIHPGVQHEAAEQVAQSAATTWSEGLETTVHAVPDSPSKALIDTAQAVGADVIVVGSKGMRGARRVLGSVPNSIAHSAACAVLIVKTD